MVRRLMVEQRMDDALLSFPDQRALADRIEGIRVQVARVGLLVLSDKALPDVADVRELGSSYLRVIVLLLRVA